MIIHYTERWKCRNRKIDHGGKAVPKNPNICAANGCPEYKEISVDQEDVPFVRCLQGGEGTLKSGQFKHIWESLGR